MPKFYTPHEQCQELEQEGKHYHLVSCKSPTIKLDVLHHGPEWVCVRDQNTGDAAWTKWDDIYPCFTVEN